MNGTQPVKCGVWLRVSTDHQTASNQIPEVEGFVAHHGFEESVRYEISESAWNGGKEDGEYRKTLQRMLDDAWAGKFTVLIVWAVDRIVRDGSEGLLRIRRQLRERGSLLVSVKESWLNNAPEIQDVLDSFAGWQAQSESQRKSERITAGLARRRTEGLPVGGRVAGAKDKRKRKTKGYEAAWKEGGTQREAREKLARTLTCQNPECGKEFTSTVTTEQKYCSMACREAVRALRRGVEGARDAVALLEAGSLQVTPEQERVARARAGSPEAPWSGVAAGLGMSRAEAVKHYRLAMMKVATEREKAAEREAMAKLVAEVSPEARAVLLAEINRHAFGEAQIAAKRAAQENGSGEDQR